MYGLSYEIDCLLDEEYKDYEKMVQNDLFNNKDFTDEALNILKQTLNNDYDDLHILLQDEAMIDEAAYEIFKYATSMCPDVYEEKLFNEFMPQIKWHIYKYFDIYD